MTAQYEAALIQRVESLKAQSEEKSRVILELEAKLKALRAELAEARAALVECQQHCAAAQDALESYAAFYDTAAQLAGLPADSLPSSATDGAILAKLVKREWISVEDALPEAGDDAPGYSDVVWAHTIGLGVMTGYYDHNNKKWWLFTAAGCIELSVTHWMPLPHAPTA